MQQAVRIASWLALAGAALVSAGCASVAGGNVQKMYVHARTADGAPVDGAQCTLSNDKGRWQLQSPGDSSIVRSNKPMEVRCERPPLPAGVVSVESGTRAAMFGNILLGGVVGAVVDHETGAAYEYPEHVRVVMGQTSTFTLPRGARADDPPPTSYAAIGDVAAVPYMGQKGRDAYREWLTKPQPRAFAVSSNRYYHMAWGTKPQDTTQPSDPKERALAGCERSAKMTCKLYAVNGNVVWDGERPLPAVAAAPAAAPIAVSTTTAPARPQPGFIASGYAATEDVDALPYLSDDGRAAYREWLTRPTPKAFAISDTGHWWAAWGLRADDATQPTDPNERALAACTRAAGKPCKLYAVNGSVVWRP